MDTQLLCILTGIFGIPLLVGLVLLVKHFVKRRDGGHYCLLAAAFTLKPLIASPLWLLIAGGPGLPKQVMLPLSILPGVGLTALIVLAFRSSFSRPMKEIPRSLLIFDCVRWLNSLLALSIAALAGYSGIGFAFIFAFVGLALPSIYAIYALSATRERSAPPISEASV